MNVMLQELAPEFIDQVGPLCARAFGDYPLLAELFPNDAEKRAVVTSRVYHSTVVDCLEYGVVHALVEDKRLLGLAAWLRPGAYPQSLRRQAGMFSSATAALRYFPRRAGLGLQALIRLDRYHPHTPKHWYLATIAIDAGAQGKGLGARLMNRGLQMVDAKGEPCFLETARPTNRNWYQGFGFEVQRSEPCFDGGPPQWFMWRPPADAAIHASTLRSSTSSGSEPSSSTTS
ncbi:GNAT family N-acetyltransferase [Myxococcaceae bacterium JPH2]|nr:GNAT family N-acetyltransferase [Myxococcaceae bacterium JPH2]